MPSTPSFFSSAMRANDFGRIVPSGARYHGHSSRRRLHGDFDDGKMLIMLQRGTFACCAAGHEEMNSLLDLPTHQRRQRFFIQAAGRTGTA